MSIVSDAKDVLMKKMSSKSESMQDILRVFESKWSLPVLFKEIENKVRRRGGGETLKVLTEVLELVLRSKQNITKDSFVVQNLNRALQSNNAVLQKMSLNVLKTQTENVSAFLPTLISLTLVSEESEDVADVVLKFAKDVKIVLNTVRKALHDTSRKDSVAFMRALNLLARLCKSRAVCMSLLESGEELDFITKSISGNDPLLVLSLIEMLPELFVLESDDEVVTKMLIWFRDSNLMTTLLSYACVTDSTNNDAFASMFEAPSLRVVSHVLALDRRGMRLFGEKIHQQFLSRLKDRINCDDDAVSSAALKSIEWYCSKCDETIWNMLLRHSAGVFDGVIRLAFGRKVKVLAAAAALRTVASLLESMKSFMDSSNDDVDMSTLSLKLYDGVGGMVSLLKVVHTSFEISHQHAACEVLCACSKHNVLLKRMLTESDAFRNYLSKTPSSTSTDLRVREWAICTVVYIMQNKSSRSLIDGMCDEGFVKNLGNIVDVAAGKRRAPAAEPEFRVDSVV